MENLNRLLLENVLPAHVAEHFLARNLKNEVMRSVFTMFVINWSAIKPTGVVHTCDDCDVSLYALYPDCVSLNGVYLVHPG